MTTTLLDAAKAAQDDEPMCSSCGFPLKEYTAGLRHFGTHTAHIEWYCVQRLKGEIERLRAAIAEAEEVEPVATCRTWHKAGEQHAELWEWTDALAALPDGEHNLYTRPPAERKPVAWSNHVEQRMLQWRRRFANRSGDRLALDDFMDKESLDDLIDFVCDEWVGPPQHEPLTFAQGQELLAIAIKHPTIYEEAAFRKGVKAAERAHGIGDRCRYPECVENELEECQRWISGECPGPGKSNV